MLACDDDVKTAVRLRALAGLLASLVLAACNLGAVPGQVDGWSIGGHVSCAPADARCQQMIEVATKRLDQRDPGHPAVAIVTVHEEGLYPNDEGGGEGFIIRSGGPPTVIVFVLEDGSRRAIGVKYVLTNDVPTTYDHGPERRDVEPGNEAPAQTT